MKFHDLNANGAKDSGEGGLGGWTIYVDYNDNDVLDTGEPYDVTASDGTYTIEGIVPGTWKVKEVGQTDWFCSYPDPCYHEELFNSDDDLTGNDFGNWQYATKRGMKFEDVDGSGGPYDSAVDQPLEGWNIHLLQWIDGAWVHVNTDTFTDEFGMYEFDTIVPGETYAVCEVAQDNWEQSFPAVADIGTGGLIDCFAIAAIHGPVGYQITLDSGEVDEGNDFGNWEYATKSGFKWHDVNRDGVKDAEEDFLSMWTIELWDVSGASPVFVFSDTTDINGLYEFDEIVPGVDYAVCEVLENGWFQSYPVGGSPLPAGLYDCSQLGAEYGAVGYAITLTSGEEDLDNNFGNWVEEGCTFTQGYWKTHSVEGPAGPPDPGWEPPYGPGHDATFFLSGKTWLEVLQTPPKGGNAYYILAHQWIAAYLNMHKPDDPATMPADVYVVFLNAEDFFNTYAPDDDFSAMRDRLIAWAELLTDYNEGLVGPGHCDDQ
jgi:hypothetical protein